MLIIRVINISPKFDVYFIIKTNFIYIFKFLWRENGFASFAKFVYPTLRYQ